MPVAVCQTATVALDANGSVEVQPADIDGGSTVPAGHFLTVSPAIFDCSAVGTPQNIRLFVRDQFGIEQSSCTTTITVTDNLPPTAICQDATIFLDANGQVSVAASLVDNGSTDNCSVTNFSLDKSNFDCSNIGANTVILTVADASNNINTCTAIVTIEDNVLPNALCANVTVPLDANGQATINAAVVDGGSSDNCAIASTIVNINQFDCSNLGPNPVVFTVTDINNNVSTCSATVTIVDNLIPSALCTNSSVNLDANGQANITAATVDGGASDNCAIQSTTIDKTNFDCSDLGPNLVTLTVTDIFSNVNTCTATITIVDNTPPVLTCQSSTTVQLNAAGFGATGPFFLITSLTDNCSVPYPFNNLFLDCSDIGQQNFTINATDPSGNTSSCTVVVTVVDNVAPTVSCKTISVSPPQGGSVSISPEDVEDILSSDACGIASKIVTPNSFTCNDTGANLVTLTITDVNGNVSSCNATVNVSCLLPVEWGSFEGFSQKNDVVLEWVTLQEENNAYFEIEHSRSGLDFEAIGQMQSYGDSFEAQAYQFIHSKASPGAHYYRIRQVDYDGVYTVSSIVQVEVNTKTTETTLQVFPNPSQDRLYYKLPVTDRDNLSVSVYNKLGQKIHHATFSGVLEVGDWDPGLYWLIISDEREEWRAVFVVQ